MTGSTDNSIKVWSTKTAKEYFTLTGHTDRITSLAINEDFTVLVSGSSDCTIKMWSLEEKKIIRTLQGHQQYVFSVAISNNA